MDIGPNAECIVLGEDEVTWNEAVGYCISQGGYLWDPESEVELSAVFEVFKNLRIDRGNNTRILL